MTQASAPGKIILFGEHAVVYGRPAIAVPVTQVQATATVTPAPPGTGVMLDLADIGQQVALANIEAAHPLSHVARLALAQVSPGTSPDWLIRVTSSIPVASGLGSGAATATAIVRALAQAAHCPLDPAQVSALVYESEKFFHGTPSGVDNTVVTYQQPVWFVRGRPPEPFAIGHPFTVVISDTGIPSPTSITVGDVRRGWEADPEHYEALFDAIAGITLAARRAIELGDTNALGPLMDENQRQLQAMGVSSPELDRLCAAARAAGAGGAKLSGGGRGGNMIALAGPEFAAQVSAALLAAGATRTIITTAASTTALPSPGLAPDAFPGHQGPGMDRTERSNA